MNEISPYKKRHERGVLCLVRIKQEGNCLQARKRVLSRNLLVGFPASGTLRNKFLLFRPTGHWYLL